MEGEAKMVRGKIVTCSLCVRAPCARENGVCGGGEGSCICERLTEVWHTFVCVFVCVFCMWAVCRH